MVKEKTFKIALMSIHPEFARLILDGRKKVEFRKVRFASHVSHVVIYATTPVKKVVGYFEVLKIQVGNPDELWNSYNQVAGIDKLSFQDYYDNRSSGVAIEIGQVYHVNKFISLDEISTSLVAPQSYMYLEKEKFNLIKANSIRS
jgi:predicted transcriptional regulator